MASLQFNNLAFFGFFADGVWCVAVNHGGVGYQSYLSLYQAKQAHCVNGRDALLPVVGHKWINASLWMNLLSVRYVLESARWTWIQN